MKREAETKSDPSLPPKSAGSLRAYVLIQTLPGRLEGVAKVASVKVEDENLAGHLQSPDFFDAERFPELRFVSSSIERDGDVVVFDIPTRQLRVELSDEEISKRLSGWKAPSPRFQTGVMAKYAKLVSSASLGAVTN